MTGEALWVRGLVTGGLDRAAVAAYLRSQGMTDMVAVYDGPMIPTQDPGVMVVLTWLPGAGFSVEEALDTPAVQVRTIGPQGDYDAARDLARTVDVALLGIKGAMFGGKWVVVVRRAGGSPSIDRVDDADRAHYVCTYLADVESDQPREQK